MLVGAVVGVVVALYAYRRSPTSVSRRTRSRRSSRRSRGRASKEVTNSTIVVIVDERFATVFLALLDRFWGFVTNLVYGS